MIYFYDELVAKTLETIKEAHDCAGILHDLNRIDQAIANIRLCGGCAPAYQLDKDLRRKYPCIDSMVAVANSMPVPAPQIKKTYSVSEAIVSNLKQDHYGILCDTALKKGLVHDIKEFIKSVN